MKPQELIQNAREVKENAHEPHSEYSVGAALLTEDGEVFEGVNVECVTFDMCSHAERTALNTAVTEGHMNFKALAISTQKEDGVPPCGTCRQYIAEFCGDDFTIYSDMGEEDGVTVFNTYKLGEIFPNAFRPTSV